MNSDRLIGLAYVCQRFHSGQWSRGYQLLSRINWRPRSNSADKLQGGEWSEARRWAAHYLRYARKHPEKF